MIYRTSKSVWSLACEQVTRNKVQDTRTRTIVTTRCSLSQCDEFMTNHKRVTNLHVSQPTLQQLITVKSYFSVLAHGRSCD